MYLNFLFLSLRFLVKLCTGHCSLVNTIRVIQWTHLNLSGYRSPDILAVPTTTLGKVTVRKDEKCLFRVWIILCNLFLLHQGLLLTVCSRALKTAKQ